EAFFLKPLVRWLGNDQPVFSFRIPDVGGARKPFRDIESMAAFFVNELVHADIPGPYRLAGYSFGAPVALEMAHQLLARGEGVAFLGFIDWVPYSSRPRSLANLLGKAWASLCNLPYWITDDFLLTPPKRKRARLVDELRYAGERVLGVWRDAVPSAGA